eukprot:TRINITY_DN19877_c0_g1_i1.p1 TRINITY_DN19877_c0_g1~~TRINITY_DN19877_c0_g1_i1.p1  ORF type:complete len:213 (+),score=20.86 TRINITY_DN19877_c0_g1_i1:59-697(+)
MIARVAFILLVSLLTSEAANTCRSDHVQSACLAGHNYTGSCCVDSSTHAAGCKSGYYKEIISRGCGGDSVSIGFITLASKASNLEVCCYEESATGMIVAIVVPVVLAVALVAAIVACCMCDCCGNKAAVNHGGAPAVVVGQAVQPVVQLQPAQVINVAIPAGMVPGQQMSVKTPYGTDMLVTIPPGVQAGSTIQVTCPQPVTVAAVSSGCTE